MPSPGLSRWRRPSVGLEGYDCVQRTEPWGGNTAVDVAGVGDGCIGAELRVCAITTTLSGPQLVELWQVKKTFISFILFKALIGVK